jgi:hypothetical protein
MFKKVESVVPAPISLIQRRAPISGVVLIDMVPGLCVAAVMVKSEL